MRNKGKFDISGKGDMDSTCSTCLCSNKCEYKEWPHAGPLQSGLAWTIATLCWSIPRFFLARPRPADDSLSHILPSTPVCLRNAGAQLHMISRALGIKSRTVSKDLQNALERAIQASDTGNPLHSAMASLACGTGACRGHYDSWLWWLQWHHEWNDVGRSWNSFHYVDI